MISVDEATERVLALAGPPVSETVHLEQAYGRALLEPAAAQLTQPPFNAAAMDGYALRAIDLDGPLRIIGEAAAGRPWAGKAEPGTAIRIFTGAPVPAGYDQVVMQEHARREGDSLILTERSLAPHIRPRGNDFAKGDSLPAGRRLNAADIGLLAAMNVPRVIVAARPRVALLAGGDELTRPGETLHEGQIVSSNDLALAAQVIEAGGIPIILPIARDTEESLHEGLTAAAKADLIVTLGGASVGDHDLVGRVAEKMGLDRAFYRIAMRPGKPLMAGHLSHRPMLGLPGNPVSAMVCGILFMQPLIHRMQGLPGNLQLSKARLGRDLAAEGDRQHYLRAMLSDGHDLPVITPDDNQDSARLSLMSQADALLVRPAQDRPRKAGDIVAYLPLSR